MKCENCGGPINTPHLYEQRFCSHACGDEWFMAERREAVQWYRALGMKPELKARRKNDQQTMKD